MNVRTHSPPGTIERKVNIVQGENHVDNDPNVVITTILGSCIAACLWDEKLGLGGMNHFLLPGTEADAKLPVAPENMRFGIHAMELLVNGLLKRGAQRARLRAKLFGGARMIKGLTDIGESNARFAEQFLAQEGIVLVGGSLRGEQGRRIQFWPSTGRARQVLLAKETESIMRAERTKPPPPPPPSAGALELF